MNKYEIQLSAMVTIMEIQTLEVSAESEDEAIEKAKKEFDQLLEHKHGYCDYDEARVEETVMTRWNVEE